MRGLNFTYSILKKYQFKKKLNQAKRPILIDISPVGKTMWYEDDTTLMAESEEELKSLLMKVKVESEKVGLNSTFSK